MNEQLCDAQLPTRVNPKQATRSIISPQLLSTIPTSPCFSFEHRKTHIHVARLIDCAMVCEEILLFHERVNDKKNGEQRFLRLLHELH